MNELYPVFLKTRQLTLLVAGGGKVAHEKLTFLWKSSPGSRVRLVATRVSPQVRELIAAKGPLVEVFERPFAEPDLEGVDLVIAATNDRAANLLIRRHARERHLLVNVADTPDLCDFYLGSIVTKGDLKIAISTNGRSPTFARRFREMLEELLPASIPEMLVNLRTIRDALKGDFTHKVDRLNELTSILSAKGRE